MALFPLALFWLSKLGGRWSHLLVGALLTVAVAVIAIKLLTSRREERIQLSWPVAALVVIFAASLGVRLCRSGAFLSDGWIHTTTPSSPKSLDTGRTTLTSPYADLDSFLYTLAITFTAPSWLGRLGCRARRRAMGWADLKRTSRY
jgi:thiol:disulfide interchange protein